MFPTLLVPAALVVAAVLVLAPLRVALTALMAVVLYVPSGIVLPHSPSAQFTLPRLAVAAFALGLCFKLRSGEATDAFRPTRMHVVLGVYVVVTFVLGVVLAEPQIATRAAMHEWLLILEEVLFFGAVLGALRNVDLRWAARMVAALVFGTAVIAALEGVTKHGYTAYWYRHLPYLLTSDKSILRLQLRGGHVRVQAAALFSLELGWVLAMWLPMVAVVALWSRRRLALIAPALVVLAMMWTYSRSIFVGLAAGAAVLVVASLGDRKVLAAVLVAAALGLGAVAASPSLRSPYHAADTASSSQSRVTRAQVVSHAVVDRPYHGFGFGALTELGLQGTDGSYVLVYAELGVLGLALFAVLFGTALGEGLSSLRIPRGRDRTLAASAVAGLAVAPVAAAAYDFTGIEQSMLSMLFLAAFAIAMRERFVRAPAERGSWLRWPSAAEASVVVAGVLLGVVVSASAPRHWAGTWRMQTVQARRLDEERSAGHESFPGAIFRNTVCGIARQAALAHGHVNVLCAESFESPLGAGIGDIRIEAPTRAEVGAVAADVFVPAAQHVPGFEPLVLEPVARGKPTLARTAPVTSGVLGLAVAVLVPLPHRRRAGRVPVL